MSGWLVETGGPSPAPEALFPFTKLRVQGATCLIEPTRQPLGEA